MKKLNRISILFMGILLFYGTTHAQLLEPIDMTWGSLQTEFNNRSNYPRIVSILSVNCIPCRLHRDDIRDQVMNQCPNPDLRWMIVWFEDPNHPSVRNDAVSQSALISDSRVTQWWYTEHQSTTSKNDSVAYLYGDAPWIGCNYAWDMTHLYPSDTLWTGISPPAPHYCMAKVGGCCNFYSIGNFKLQVDNLGVCANTTGLDDNQALIHDVSVFPNPASNEFNISFHALANENFSLSVIDIKGKLIHKQHGNTIVGHNNIIVNLHNAASGFYTIQLQVLDNVSNLEVTIK